MKEIQLKLLPHEFYDEQTLLHKIKKQIGLNNHDTVYYRIIKKSLDARAKQPQYLIKMLIAVNEEIPAEQPQYNFTNVSHAKPVMIIGAGPAGLFAALRLIEKGIKPIIFERGKDVRARRRDIAAHTKHHLVNPESNYCFGEGGAGTYSDGKLYTRSTKRGDVKKILQWLVLHGAGKEILYEAHPHIGTNKLPAVITNIRNTILQCGGEIHFNAKLTDIFFDSQKINGIEINHTEKHNCKELILATGHSARDIFYLFYRKNILLEEKPIAIGVRAEHPQTLIDSIQYKCAQRNKYLPPASYSLVEQINNSGVYSFCMCPGGIIAPCATSQQEIVTNGWSPSKRNNPFANSGIVTTITHEDLKAFNKYGVLKYLKFQEEVEKNCWIAGGKTQTAPAQRMVDFTLKKTSNSLLPCSYQPGGAGVNLHDILPTGICLRLSKAFTAFGKKMKGYYTNEAMLVAVESRTSSPIRIPRHKDTLQHLQLEGLYPCGEGAGYAGGIISAAIDGVNCAEKIS
jgi:uncharacterized FAD-dependent dehydrogenase